MNININDIKNGMTVIIDGNLCLIQEFQHVKPGKGPAFVRIKLKNLRTGSIVEQTFNTNIKITRAHIDKNSVQYLYASGDNFVFMNNETIKKFDITIKLRGDNVYDLYMNNEWIASRGSCENIVDEVKNEIRKTLYEN